MDKEMREYIHKYLKKHGVEVTNLRELSTGDIVATLVRGRPTVAQALINIARAEFLIQKYETGQSE